MSERTCDRLRPSPALAGVAPDVEVPQGRHPHRLHRPANAVPDPCVVSRGFAPDSGYALLTLRSHFSSPAVLTRDGRGGVSSAARPRVPASCGANQRRGLREACTAPPVSHDDFGPTTSQSLPEPANARFPGEGTAKACSRRIYASDPAAPEFLPGVVAIQAKSCSLVSRPPAYNPHGHSNYSRQPFRFGYPGPSSW